MTVKNFISWALETGPLDWDKAYSAQCVDLFRYFHNKCVNSDTQPRGVVGAKNFWTNYETDPVLQKYYTKISNTPEYVPQEGDVIIWRNGTYGHIAVAIGEGDTNKFKSLDQNWQLKNEIAIVEHTYGYVYGCLRPKSLQSTSETMQPNYQELFGVKTIEELKTVWDREMAFLKSEREKNDKLKADNATYKSEAASRKQELDKFIEELAKRMFLPAASDKSDITAGVDRLLTVEDQLSAAKKALTQEEKKHDQEKSEMQQEIDNLKAEIAQDKADRDATEKKLLGRIENLENRLNDNESAVDATNQFKAFIDKLLSIFTKEK